MSQLTGRNHAKALFELVKRNFKTPDQPTNDGGLCENLLLWSLRRRSLVKPDVPFNLSNHKYLIGIYTTNAKHIVIKKASQVGVSEWAISKAFHACDVRQANVLYVMPTSTDVSDFSSMRVGPAIKASTYLAKIMAESSDTDRVGLKEMRNNFIVFRGGQVGSDGSARQLKSVPVDIAIRDEVDEMDSRVEVITDKRLSHSALKEKIAISTPSFVGVGIDAEWALSDQREWFVPCPSCQYRQKLDINMCVTDWDDVNRPINWHGKDDGRAWLACNRCGKELDRLAMGEWVARYPSRTIAGFHPTKLFTMQTPLVSIVEGLQESNDSKRKEVYNQDLGEGYKPKGGSLSDNDLNKCVRDYMHGRHQTTLPAVMGVDVGSVLHVVIRLHQDSSGDRRQLYAGEVANFSDVSKLMKRFNVRICVVDALPETRSVRLFQDSHPRSVVWACFYGLDPKHVDPVKWAPRGEKQFVTTDRTRTLDETFSRFYDSYNTLPANAESISNYYDQMKSPVRTLVDSAGVKVARYIESGADHFSHAENYCTIASMRPLGWARG